MLDIKRIRKNPEALVAAMKSRRSKGADVTGLLELDEKRRKLIVEVEALKAKRNEDSAKVPMLKKQGLDASDILAEMKQVADKIKALDAELTEIDSQLDDMLMKIPNIPHESVPDGADDRDNAEIRNDTVRALYRVEIVKAPEKREQVAKANPTAGDSKPQPKRVGTKIGPNDPCPCGSGKKYKKCCGRTAE